jgi:hypothetical protein
MNVLRILLLPLMSLIILMMVCFPGLWDSKRYFEAYRHYRDAPSGETKREIEDAKRLHSRDIMVFEFVMLGFFGLSVYAFIRTGKRVDKVPGP